MKKWTTILTPTTFNIPGTNEPLYVWKKVRPQWYWKLKRLLLFLIILWRRWEDARLSWSLSWSVACGIYEDEIG